MAGFEASRSGTVSEITREWRVSRYLPLYLAGIAAGTALGIALTMQVSGGETHVQTRLPIVSRAVVTAAPETRWAEMPTIAISPTKAEIETGPPATVLLALPGLAEPAATGAAEVRAAPISAPVVAPVVAPITPTAPVEAAPAVPVSPVAVQPVAQPEAAAAPVAPAPPTAKDDFYVPAVVGGGANNLEARLFAGMNVERAAAGLPALTYDAGLTKVARTRAQQMADQGYFGHVDPHGYSMYTALLKHFGYTSYAWAGENLAMNNAAAAEASERSLVSLMNSPTHRANILANDFFRVGVGEVTTADGRHIFAMIFLG